MQYKLKVTDYHQLISFFHVTHVQVDYREKAAAGGQIPKNFFRKDSRLSDRETLVSRRMGKFHILKALIIFIK